MADRFVWEQLGLELFSHEKYTLSNFYPGANGEVLAAIEQWIAGGEPRLVHLWGTAASGKTHLLQAAINAIPEPQRAIYLPLRELCEQAPDILEGIEDVPFVVVDDLEYCLTAAQWENRLFSLYNQQQNNGGRLILASRRRLLDLEFGLRDLQSRFESGLSLQVRALDDDGRRKLMGDKARALGCSLSETVMDYLLRHCSRDASDLITLIEALDKRSLRHSRAISVPMIKEHLAQSDAKP